MLIRKTTSKDVLQAAEIYENARRFMRANGNMDQWWEGYPGINEIESDIREGTGYVCEEDGEIVAVFYFRIGEDPTYKAIYNGAWLDESPYAVIHRVAVKYNGRGTVNKIYEYCYFKHPHLRIDTHTDNIPMQRSLSKNGFKYCGIIHLPNGDERWAYEKI